MVINERISFEHILCPVDLTEESNEGLRYAVALARAYDAKLTICHCSDRLAIAGEMEFERAKKHIESFIRKRLYLAGGVRLNWEFIVVGGDTEFAITGEAARRRIDLIVMRSRRRPHGAALLGSTAEAICRTAPCPVLVTHPHQSEWVGMTTGEMDIKRVLVAYDFSIDSELALSYGLSIAQKHEAELYLLHVLPARQRPEAPEIALLPLSVEGAYYSVAHRLESAIPATTFLGHRVRHAVREGMPYREVLDYCDEHDIDLICMGAHGTGFGMRALFGSNVDRVLRQAPCPVLIARPLRPLN